MERIKGTFTPTIFGYTGPEGSGIYDYVLKRWLTPEELEKGWGVKREELESLPPLPKAPE